jgi:hypothetical protein
LLAGWPRWNGSIYVFDNQVCEIIDGYLYYLVCIKQNSNQDPSSSPSYWIVSDVVTMPYNYKLHYKIVGTAVTFTDGNCYLVI